MTTVNSTTNTGSTTATSSTNGVTGVSANDVEDRFLKLLVAQLKNQDPLNPQDNAQITSQMAQLSTVTGIEKLNTSMSTLASSVLGSQAAQAAGLIGRTVLVNGDSVTLSNGSAMGAFNLDTSATSAVVEIRDLSGTLVKTLNFSNLPAGVNDFTWDGTQTDGTKVSDGRYQMSVKAFNGQDTVNTTALSYSKVNSIQMGSGSFSLNIDGQTSGLSLDEIKEIN